MTFLVGGIDALDPVSVGTLNGLAANQHPSRHGTIVLSAHKTFSYRLDLSPLRG
jgi:hypothetical protein